MAITQGQGDPPPPPLLLGWGIGGVSTLAVTGRQRRTRRDAITAFYTRGKGGWVDGRGAVVGAWVVGCPYLWPETVTDPYLKK